MQSGYPHGSEPAGRRPQRDPSPCTPNWRSRPDTARRTINMDGDGGSGPGVVDSHSKLGGGEGTAAWVAKGVCVARSGRATADSGFVYTII